jgi:HK97 gp10 family phage protein
MREDGFYLDEFDELIKQIELLGANTDAVAEAVLDAGVAPAKEAFRNNVPYDTERDNPQGHARDNIKVSKTKTSKYGTKYRVISFKGDRSYLYMVDAGTSQMPAKPWREKANRAAQAAARPAMAKELVNQLEKHLR